MERLSKSCKNVLNSKFGLIISPVHRSQLMLEPETLTVRPKNKVKTEKGRHTRPCSVNWRGIRSKGVDILPLLLYPGDAPNLL